METPPQRTQQLQRLVDACQWRRAAQLASELSLDDPSHPRWHRTAGQCALHLDEPREAQGHLAEALRLSPRDHLARYFLSHSLRLEGEPEAAERELRRALEIQPGDPDYWVELGWLAFERNDATSSLRCAKKAMALDPRCPRAATLLAAAKSQTPPKRGGHRGDPQAQIESLRQTLQLEPDNDAALHNIGVVYFNELRDYREAERYFRRALAIAPNEALYQKHLTRSLRRQEPLLRALHAPRAAIGAIAAGFVRLWETRRLAAIALLPCVPPLLLVALLVFLFWLIFLWPPATFYEHLALRGVSRRAKMKTARLALSLAALSSFWLLVVGAFHLLAFQDLLIYSLAGIAIGWLGISVYFAWAQLRTVRDGRARKISIDLLES